MSALGSKLRAQSDGHVAFWCPGCDEAHTVRPRPAASPSWEFNGDGDRPTFAPSILVTGTQRLTDDEYARVMRGEHVEPRPLVCHSFVRDGNIQFLDDCTHALAGQTVPLPDWPTGEDA
jgi:hypothetical protein